MGNKFGKDGVNHSKRDVLKEMNVFVLDNSLRESTVGQVVGHSLKDKKEIIEAIEECNFKHYVVGAFSDYRRVDDAYCETMLEKEEVGPNLVKNHRYAFSEVTDKVVDGVPQFGENHVPVGLKKMKMYKIPHVIIEIDLDDSSGIDYSKFSVRDLVKGLKSHFEWATENLPQVEDHDPMNHNFVNLRDFPLAMVHNPRRVLTVIKMLAQLPRKIRPMGLLYEEPMGEYFPEEIARWTHNVREVMNKNGWKSLFQKDGKTTEGLLCVHVHKQWGIADAAVLDCLAAGADGIWCSISEEGAAMGHACSAVTLANLARLGNSDILTRYNTRKLAHAARAVTKIVTNRPVADRQLVYGPRAVEAVFGFGGIAGGMDANVDIDGDGVTDHFSLAKFLGVPDPPIRISSLASPDLVVKALEQWFGPDRTYTVENASKMLNHLRGELEFNVEMEHTSAMGLATLWQSCFQQMPDNMRRALLVDEEPRDHKANLLIKEAERVFMSHVAEGNNGMSYKSFYDVYLQPFMGCFSCPKTRFVLSSIDLDADGSLSWREWRFWCMWALRCFPEEIGNIDELHSVVLRNAIIPNSLVEGPTEIISAERLEKHIDELKK